MGGTCITLGLDRDRTNRYHSALRVIGRKIFANAGAFAATNFEGKIVTWGEMKHGGCIIQDINTCDQELSSEPLSSKRFMEIYNVDYGFAALCKDNTVFSWGSVDDRGTIPLSSAAFEHVNNVETIYTTASAVAALRKMETCLYGAMMLPGDVPVPGQTTRSIPVCLIT